MNSKQNKISMFKSLSLIAILFLPAVSLAASAPPNPALCVNIRSLFGLFGCFGEMIKGVIIIAVALALMFFIWNLAMYIKDYDNEAKRTDSKQYMIYAIIALFVMISVWGLVGILTNTFGFTSGGPQYNTGGGSNSTSGNTTDSKVDWTYGNTNY